jgi:hypothetical protein
MIFTQSPSESYITRNGTSSLGCFVEKLLKVLIPQKMYLPKKIFKKKPAGLFPSPNYCIFHLKLIFNLAFLF